MRLLVPSMEKPAISAVVEYSAMTEAAEWVIHYGGNARDVYLVVADDLDVRSEHAKLLHQVVREGVVVVYHQDHGNGPF